MRVFRAFALFSIIILYPFASYSQQAPPSFANAEQSSTPTPLPDNYTYYSYSSSTGSKMSSSASASHTFGVQTDGSMTGDNNSSTKSTAVLGISSGSSVVNSIGGPGQQVSFTTTGNQQGSMPNIDAGTNGYSTSSSVSTSTSGISAAATLVISPSVFGDCSLECLSGSYFASESQSLKPTDVSNPATSSVNGSAKGFLNSTVNTQSDQSSFTQVLLQTF